MRPAPSSTVRFVSQRGYTLVEILVALVLGLFLVAGVLMIVQDNRRVFGNQTQLAQLQDSERLAMTMITDVIQSAGYYPNPAVNPATAFLTNSAPFALGQSITGTGAYTDAAPGDTIAVRYATQSGDGILTCAGFSNTSGGTLTYVNSFSVVVNAQGVSQLVCTVGGTAYPLVSNVLNLQIRYGVTRNAASGDSVDTYVEDAAQMTAADWSNVRSVTVSLVFQNPMANQPGQPATLTFTRVVDLMGAGGVSIT